MFVVINVELEVLPAALWFHWQLAQWQQPLAASAKLGGDADEPLLVPLAAAVFKFVFVFVFM